MSGCLMCEMETPCWTFRNMHATGSSNIIPSCCFTFSFRKLISCINRLNFLHLHQISSSIYGRPDVEVTVPLKDFIEWVYGNAKSQQDHYERHNWLSESEIFHHASLLFINRDRWNMHVHWLPHHISWIWWFNDVLDELVYGMNSYRLEY